MKQTILLFFILLSFKGFCQKWHLQLSNSKTEYKYEYWFQFENSDDSCKYVFEKSKGKLNSTINLTDNNGDKIFFASIRIQNLKNDSTILILTDTNGFGQLLLSQGDYKIKIYDDTYDELTFIFSLAENEFFTLNAKLGLAPELTVYQINVSVRGSTYCECKKLT